MHKAIPFIKDCMYKNIDFINCIFYYFLYFLSQQMFYSSQLFFCWFNIGMLTDKKDPIISIHFLNDLMYFLKPHDIVYNELLGF